MKRTFLLLILLFNTAPAWAHINAGPVTGFVAGFAHPMGGLDHVTAMIAIGLWAALKGGRAVLVWPATFVASMLAGGVLGMSHLNIPLVEPGILTSVVVFGLLVTMAAEIPLGAGAAIIAVFAMLHGHAHGTEIPENAKGIEYLAGFAAATVLLHAIGVAAAMFSGSRYRNLARAGGAACMAIGFGLIAGML